LLKNFLHLSLQIRVFSRDESKQLELAEHLRYPSQLRLLIGDVRDKERLEFAMKGVQVVFHAAALKHVPFCEYNPFEVVKTNVIGSQNVIDAALANQVEKVIAVSTDKAANPVGIMGVSKLMMEKLFTSANYYKGDIQTKFASVRFGNVAWARGSVFPVWKSQAERHGKIRATNAEMTRFIMSQADAVRLIIEATAHMRGGEIFVFKMPSIRLIDAAEHFVKKYFPTRAVEIEVVGMRPGEKLHEELFIPDSGQDHVLESDEMFIVVPRPLALGFSPHENVSYPGFREVENLARSSSRDAIDIARVIKTI